MNTGLAATLPSPACGGGKGGGNMGFGFAALGRAPE